MALDDAKKQLKNDNYEDFMIEEAYEKVFFECIKDSRPFDRIPESVKDVDSSVDALKFILKKWTIKYIILLVAVSMQHVTQEEVFECCSP